MTFLGTAALVARKDLLVETRSREVIYTSLLFAISCILVFAFGLVKEGRLVADAAAAILWITIAFAGTLALNRIFDRERQNETLRALLLAPSSRAAIYVGKLAGVLALLLLVETIVTLLIMLMFNAALLTHAMFMLALLLAERAAAGAAVPDHDSGHHRRRQRDGRAAPARGGSGGRARLVDDAGGLRRRVPHALALDLRTRHDRVNAE